MLRKWKLQRQNLKNLCLKKTMILKELAKWFFICNALVSALYKSDRRAEIPKGWRKVKPTSGVDRLVLQPYLIFSSFVKEVLDFRLVWVNKIAKENGVTSDWNIGYVIGRTNSDHFGLKFPDVNSAITHVWTPSYSWRLKSYSCSNLHVGIGWKLSYCDNISMSTYRTFVNLVKII